MASELLQSLRSILPGKLSEASDQELLDRYVRDLDEAAFGTLLKRHGAMVRSVCRRILSNPEDAEDAAQATFLILVRRAGTIRKRNAVAAWLHGVAQRVAWKLRKRRNRRKEVEAALPATRRADSSAPYDNLMQTLDREIAALPEHYRAPLILCCLEGKTRDEAAQALGWSVGSVKGRLERGRRLLKQRLAKQGISLSLAGVLAECTAQAGVCRATLDQVLKFAAGREATSAPVGISTQAWDLARWYLAKSLFARVATGAFLVVCFATAVTIALFALTDVRGRTTTVAAKGPSKENPLNSSTDAVADQGMPRAAPGDRDNPKSVLKLRQPPARRGIAYAVVIGRSSPAGRPRIRLSINGKNTPVQVLEIRNKTGGSKGAD